MKLLRYLSFRMHKPSQGKRAQGMQRLLGAIRHGEVGRTLPAALWTLALGALIMAALFALVSTSLKASTSAQGNQFEQYSSDAGIEFGVWKLLNDSLFRSQVDAAGGTPVSISPSIVVNNITTDITVSQFAAGGNWELMADLPVNVSAGGALSYTGDDYIYAFQGGWSPGFWRYSISGDSWTQMEDAPGDVGNGGALDWGGGNYIYALQGNNQRTFWRYNISNDTWQVLQRPGGRVGAGGALAHEGGDYVFVFRGNDNFQFWRYSISADGWKNRRNAPEKVGAGGALAYISGNDIYAMRGKNTTDFWRYNIADNDWYFHMSTIATVGSGGALAYSGGDKIYALRGNGTTDFWNYSISGGTWSLDTSTPNNVSAGGDLVYTTDESIYALRGDGRTAFWKYTASGAIYEIVSQAGAYSITSQVQIDDSDVEVLFWTISGTLSPQTKFAFHSPLLIDEFSNALRVYARATSSTSHTVQVTHITQDIWLSNRMSNLTSVFTLNRVM